MELTKQELEKIYRNNRNEKAARMLKCSVPTLIKYVKNAGLELKGVGGGKKNKLLIIG